MQTSSYYIVRAGSLRNFELFFYPMTPSSLGFQNVFQRRNRSQRALFKFIIFAKEFPLRLRVYHTDVGL
jgi:hypothetical protein